MKDLMNCVFRYERKGNYYLLEMRLVLISNYPAAVSINEHYTNLFHANQLKKRICRSTLSVIEKQRTQWNTKAQKTQCYGCTFSSNYTVTELIDVVRKKEPPIFICKGIILTLKLVTWSSDSTKIPFLPAIRPPVIGGRIVMPHLSLGVCKYIVEFIL